MYNKNKTSYNMNIKYLIENSDFAKLQQEYTSLL